VLTSTSHHRNALNGLSYKIHFFYGPYPSDWDQYDDALNLIGTYQTFTGKPVPADPVLSHSQISLSPVLAYALQHGVISDLDPDAVKPVLLANLNWRVTDASGDDITSNDVVKKIRLRIVVVSRTVSPLKVGEDDRFPQYGSWVEHPDLTEEKLGGWTEDDD
jgi:hypothetical protein